MFAFWWAREPERWAAELVALVEDGWRVKITDIREGEGIITVTIWPEQRAADDPRPPSAAQVAERLGDAGLTVTFPPTYPYFPPRVYDPANALGLTRHRATKTGELCLISAADWNVDHSAASLLAEQLPAALAADGGDTHLEAQTPEPALREVTADQHAQVLVDGAWRVPPEIPGGLITVRFRQGESHVLGAGVVEAVTAPGLHLRTFRPEVLDCFPYRLVGRWVRWNGHDPTAPPAQTWQQMADVDRAVNGACRTGPRPSPHFQLLAALVPSETHYRTTDGHEWLFVVRARPSVGKAWTHATLTGAPAGPGDIAQRRPETIPLADKQVVVVGLGGLGGPVAHDLARAGVGGLDLIDGDVSDPATGCRQHAPIIYAGLPKVWTHETQILQDSPHTHVSPWIMRLGAVPRSDRDNAGNDHEFVLDLVAGADLVVDTTAYPTCSRYLAALCATARVPFVHASATAGGWGGVVARIRPGTTSGCWGCLQHHRHGHTVPTPPAATTGGTVAPTGCPESTYVATGADLAGIAAHAARLSIHTLLADDNDFDDLNTAAMRDQAGRAAPLTWSTQALRRHPECGNHLSDAPWGQVYE
ncbi:ThiF family adenylyltransferase [Solicola sp. PLA-1-18]|uniref:ThiF family adenylyltransferase n=1 Tax=Solicola sp. PLA-1-18 TaxID=3380532 RepID=UPI003B78184D